MRVRWLGGWLVGVGWVAWWLGCLLSAGAGWLGSARFACACPCIKSCSLARAVSRRVLIAHSVKRPPCGFRIRDVSGWSAGMCVVCSDLGDLRAQIGPTVFFPRLFSPEICNARMWLCDFFGFVAFPEQNGTFCGQEFFCELCIRFAKARSRPVEIVASILFGTLTNYLCRSFSSKNGGFGWLLHLSNC